MPAIPVPVPNSTTVRPCSETPVANAQSANSSEPRHTCVGAWVTISADILSADQVMHIQTEAHFTGVNVQQTEQIPMLTGSFSARI